VPPFSCEIFADVIARSNRTTRHTAASSTDRTKSDSELYQVQALGSLHSSSTIVLVPCQMKTRLPKVLVAIFRMMLSNLGLVKKCMSPHSPFSVTHESPMWPSPFVKLSLGPINFAWPSLWPYSTRLVQCANSIDKWSSTLGRASRRAGGIIYCRVSAAGPALMDVLNL
jgi:hypothetical protein